MSARRMRGRGGPLLAAAPTSGRRASARAAPAPAAVFPPAPWCSSKGKSEMTTSRVFGKAAGFLVCGVLLASGCGLVPRSQTPQEALGLPQAETPFSERVSIEEYLRSEEPVLAGFVRTLAEKGGGTLGVSPFRLLQMCSDRGRGEEYGWRFRSETLYVVSVTDADIDEIAAQELSGLPYKGTQSPMHGDGSLILRSGDSANGGEMEIFYFPGERSSLRYESGCRPSDGSMGDLSQYTLPTTEEVFSDLVVYPAFDKDTKQPNPPPPSRGDSGQSGGSGDESGDEQ